MNSGWELPEKAFEWIEENIPFGSNIVELGSGKGTLRLSENYNVWSIEHDEEWLNLSPSKYIHAEIVPYSKNGREGRWYDPDKIKKALPEHYTLLIVDGPPSAIGRDGLLSFQEIFTWDCHILIDDTHRSEERYIAEEISVCKSLKQIAFTEYFEHTDTNREFIILAPYR